jgi:hypothetical protein
MPADTFVTFFALHCWQVWYALLTFSIARRLTLGFCPHLAPNLPVEPTFFVAILEGVFI